MIENIFLFTLNSFILLVWFKTDAFFEYFNKIPLLNKIFKFKEYLELKMKYPNINYPIFLNMEYNSFFTRLISCPICLNTWLCIGDYLLFSNIYRIFLIFFSSLILYYISVILMKYHDREES